MKWKTGITRVERDLIQVRGYDISDLIRKYSFGGACFLLFTGRVPTNEQGRMMDALLVSNIDHSLLSPSTAATRIAASGGTPLQAAVASGLLAVGSHHGGSVEETAHLFYEAVGRARREDMDIKLIAIRLLKDSKNNKRRIPGFGHSLHQHDPRVDGVLNLADELKISGDYVVFAREIERNSELHFGKHLQMNPDGAIAAVAMEMGFDWRMVRGFFIISRSAGLVAHAFEEYTRERPHRSFDLSEIEYDGPKNLKS
jgi:citryl-CoA lyase